MLIADNATRERVLGETPVQDVLGIGRQQAMKMYLSYIETAHDFACRPDVWIRQKFKLSVLFTDSKLLGL